jgi:hypothetical protein
LQTAELPVGKTVYATLTLQDSTGVAKLQRQLLVRYTGQRTEILGPPLEAD